MVKRILYKNHTGKKFIKNQVLINNNRSTNTKKSLGLRAEQLKNRNLLEYQLQFLPSHQYFHNKLYNREELQCHSWLTQNLPLRRRIECSLIHFQRTECQLKPEKPALWSLASRAFLNMRTS